MGDADLHLKDQVVRLVSHVPLEMIVNSVNVPHRDYVLLQSNSVLLMVTALNAVVVIEEIVSIPLLGGRYMLHRVRSLIHPVEQNVFVATASVAHHVSIPRNNC